jgi:hypothetical protein
MSTPIPRQHTEIHDLTIEKFYLPSENLTVRIANRIDSLERETVRNISLKPESDLPEADSDESLHSESVPASTRNSSEEVLLQRRLLAEELDACLADSAESTNGEKLNIQKMVTEGMSDALGLDVNDQLLTELASEFQKWIDKLGSFTAGWGEIISTYDGYMHLSAFPDTEEVATEPVSFTRRLPTLKAKSAKTFFAKVAAKLVR